MNDLDADAGSDTSVPFGTTADLVGSASEGSGNYAYAWSPDSLVEDASSASTETVSLGNHADLYSGGNRPGNRVCCYG